METVEISGVVRAKGNAEQAGHYWRYSMIEIGDQTIVRPLVPRSLDGYVQPGENIKLVIGKKLGKPLVVLVQRQDGKAFYANGFKPAWWFLFIGVIFLPIIIIGAPVVFAYFFHKSAYESIEKAVAAFPNKQRLPLSV